MSSAILQNRQETKPLLPLSITPQLFSQQGLRFPRPGTGCRSTDVICLNCQALLFLFLFAQQTLESFQLHHVTHSLFHK